jgi:hypothetical protein
LVQLPFTTFPDPFVGLSNATVAALLRSEVDLVEALKGRHFDDHFKEKDTYMLYFLITQMGWVRGGQILLDAGLSYRSEVHRTPPLLDAAIDSGNPAMVQFWLDARKDAEAGYLANIGNLEDAIAYAFREALVNLAQIIATHLVEQRYQLRQMAESSRIDCKCVKRSTGVLDAHAGCAIRALEEQNVDIPSSLRPTSVSIYNTGGLYSKWLGRFSSRNRTPTSEYLQFLYNVGFNDIAKENIGCHYNVYYSPLHFAIYSYATYPSCPGYALLDLFGVVDWFLAKGANITDCWPKSKITALHAISGKAGSLIFYALREFIPDDVYDRVTKFFQHKLADDCECRCSTRGCTSIASFFKTQVYRGQWGLQEILWIMRLEHIHPEDEMMQQQIRKTLECVARAAKNAVHRWFITEFIRLCVFTRLGIRHTCCDLSIVVYRHHNLDFSRPPPSRYPLDELHRIQEEDTHLVSVLEDKVALFDAQYDTHEGDLLSFIDNVLRPEMDIVLERLKQEDEAAHAVGRREMGVVMVNEHDNAVIEECENDSLEEHENNAVDEYESDSAESEGGASEED